MKSSSQYYSLAAKHWAAHWKESTLLVLFTMVVYAIIFALLEPCTMLVRVAFFAGSICLLAVGIFGMQIYYYLPVCFLALKREEPLSRKSLQINPWRAIGIAFIMFLPSMVSQLLQNLQKVDMSGGLKLTVALVGLAISVFTLIWVYAVAALPLLANDNREESVGSLTKRSWEMMDGYKWKLFCVDFLTIFIPLIIMVVVMMVMLYAKVVEKIVQEGKILTMPDYLQVFGNHIGGTIFLCVMMLILCFVWMPINGIARAMFYDDLIAEQTKATDATGQAEVVEAVVTEEVKEN